MSTTTNVSQVKVNIMSQSQYDLATKNPNEFYVISDKEYLENTTNISSSVGILGTVNNTNSVSIGNGASCSQAYTTAIGAGAHCDGLEGTAVGDSAYASRQQSIAIGFEALVDGIGSIQIGKGTNLDNSTLNVGFLLTDNSNVNYRLLDGTTGLIPDARLSSNIARTNVYTIQPYYSVTFSASSLSVPLTKSNSLYMITPTGNMTSAMTFNLSSSIVPNNATYTFELCIKMTSSVYSIIFPSSSTLTWLDGEEPDMSETGTYFFVFRTLDKGSTWLGNLQGKW